MATVPAVIYFKGLSGAYALTDNVVNAFRQAVESGAKEIKAEKV